MNRSNATAITSVKRWMFTVLRIAVSLAFRKYLFSKNCSLAYFHNPKRYDLVLMYNPLFFLPRFPHTLIRLAGIMAGQLY